MPRRGQYWKCLSPCSDEPRLLGIPWGTRPGARENPPVHPLLTHGAPRPRGGTASGSRDRIHPHMGGVFNKELKIPWRDHPVPLWATKAEPCGRAGGSRGHHGHWAGWFWPGGAMVGAHPRGQHGGRLWRHRGERCPLVSGGCRRVCQRRDPTGKSEFKRRVVGPMSFGFL